jgi:cell division protease FtsH
MGKPMSTSVDLRLVAKRTPGFTGADLANVLNEAALLTARSNAQLIDNRALDEAIDRVIAGPQRRTRVMNEKEKKITAYHEGGHALVARLLPGTDAVNKITIIPRGRAAGVTWFLPEERDFKYQDQLESDLAVAFGGRVAEELVFGRISTGASNDIKQATGLAQKMVRAWGMSADLGPLSYDQGEEQIFLGREISQHRDYSEETARKIDQEITRIIKTSYTRAKGVLEDNIDVLHKLAALLLEKETVLGRELDELIHSLRPDFKLLEIKDAAEPPEDAQPETSTEQPQA